MKSISFVKPLKSSITLRSPLCVSCREEAVQDAYSNPLSLDELFVTHPASTFFVKVGRDTPHLSVAENRYLGVSVGDVLTVDRSITPVLGRLVLAVVHGVFKLCRFTEHQGRRFLVCGDGEKTSKEISHGDDVYVWGVVTALSRSM